MSSIIGGIVKDLRSIPKGLKAKISGRNAKRLFLMNMPYVFAGYFGNKIACLWRVSAGKDASEKMASFLGGTEKMFSNPLPSFQPRDLLIGVCCGVVLRLVVYFKAKNAKKYRHGMEYGSARWGA